MIRYLPALLLIAAPAAAAPFQDVAGLDRAVAAFTGRPVGVPGGARAPVDTRLKLAQCATVSVNWRTEAHDAVVISCLGPEWKIYVPVVLDAARSAAMAAAPMRPVAAAPVIRRGDPVTIEAGNAGFSITREGVAMGDAASGARVAIKVEGAKGPVQAVAIEPGRATLPGFAE
ncbi:flagella basal body P-ring formation protein FlgA [Sphingomonas sp.]|uniref:flagella basal body P-ring formation protein FlgA n=1 Tax=Sphingomonas sp. TaxID=28214 RepID=UPI0035C834C5